MSVERVRSTPRMVIASDSRRVQSRYANEKIKKKQLFDRATRFMIGKKAKKKFRVIFGEAEVRHEIQKDVDDLCGNDAT